MAISDNIKSRRCEMGMSQETLAHAVSVSRQTIAKWESGESAPDLKNAAALAKALEVSLDMLVGYDAAATGAPLPPRGKHIFGTVTIGERGQIVIPKAAREVFHLQPGDSLVVLGDEERGIAICKAEVFMDNINALMQAAGEQK